MPLLKSLLVIVLIIVIHSCTQTYPIVKRSDGFPPADSLYYRYAVLDFDYHGQNLTKFIADRAADQFSNELYSILAFPVAERTIVRAAQKKHKESGRSRITITEIKKIAAETNADFVVLGTLNSLTSLEDSFDSKQNEIELNIRFIEAKTGEMVCNIQEKHLFNGSLKQLVHSSVIRSTRALKSALH
jgi:peptidoglycan-synthase activator LpoB